MLKCVRIGCIPARGRYDGTKMLKVAKKAKEVVKGMKGKHKDFNRKNVSEIKVMAKEAIAFSKKIGAEHRRAIKQIWLLFRPWLGNYILGVLILMVTESSWGVWYARIMALPNMALEPGVTIQKAASAW